MDRKKKTIIIVALIVVLIVIGLLIVFSPNLINRLTGNVNDANNANNDGTNTSEFVNNVCNVVADNENFLTFSGTIIEDFGDEGTALVTIKNDNMVLTKEVMVKSDEYTNFNYVLPRGTYNVTVTKAGYETYETQIKESTNLDITLHSSETVIAVSNRVFYNVYYDFYTDGTIHLKTIGNFNANDDGVVTNFEPYLLANIFIEYLHSKNFNFNPSSFSSTPGLEPLYAIMFSTIVSNSDQTIGSFNGRQNWVEAYQKIESGECNANNMLDEGCDFDKIVFYGNYDDSFTFDYAKKFIKAVIDMPVPTNLIIDDSVAFLPSLMFTTVPELTISNNILGVLPATFGYANIGTFTINSDVLAQAEDFAAGSKINNLIIGDGITSIGDSAFENATIDNITLPSTLKEIGAEAFRGLNINAITIPGSVETIGASSFANSTIGDIKLSEGLKTIGRYAFINAELTSIIIPGSVETMGEYVFSDSTIGEIILSDGLNQIESYAFYGATIDNITLPNSLTEIKTHAFRNSSIGAITIPGSVETMGERVFDGASLADVKLSEGLKTIGKNAFENATIDNITLPNTLTEIGSHAFQYSALDTITIPGSVETIGIGAFHNSSLSEINLSEGLKTIGSSAFSGTKLTSITIPASVTSISSNAFSSTPLTEVIIKGDKTRFNDEWRSIGFPEELKPSE